MQLFTTTISFIFAIMNATYPKEDKLKSRKTIDNLFKNGQSVSVYPLRLVFTKSFSATEPELQIGVSVSKKYFKKAVDRNYFKRVLRETYRQNKAIILRNAIGPHAVMLLYQSKDRLSYDEINQKTIQLFEKYVAKYNQPETDSIKK